MNDIFQELQIQIYICGKKENVDIPIDTLYEFSKKLNENDENDDEADTFLDNICDNMTIF